MGAARTADDGNLYWRISQFMMPSHALAPNAFPGENYHGQTFVPIDDELCWIYCYTWNPERPLTNSERDRYASGQTVHANVDANFVPIRNRDNDYLIDRARAEVSQLYRHQGRVGAGCLHSGQPGLHRRSHARTCSGPTDIGIVRFRRLVLDSAKALAKGQEPRAASKPEGYKVRAGGTVAHSSIPLADVMVARFGDPIGRASARQH